MKVINVLNESLKLEDIKNKIIIITKAQLNQVFDIEQQNICPFRDINNKKCKIYKVRPSICQSFNRNSDYSSIMNGARA